MDSATDLTARLGQANAMSRGPAQIAAVEAVVARADAAGLDALALRARLDLFRAYHQGGEPSKQFAVFSACLAAYQRAPETFRHHDLHSLLWDFKHVVFSMTRFPTISLAQTERVLDEMTGHYRRFGSTMHAVHSSRQQFAAHVGRREDADREFDLWRATPRDSLSDCVGCDPENQVAWLVRTGRDREAAELADEVLTGRFTCVEQPHSILTALLLSYVRLGRHQDAADAHARAYRSLRRSVDAQARIGVHLEFLALTGNEARGLEILERHLDVLDAPADVMAELEFVTAAAVLARRLVETGHGDLVVRGGSVPPTPARDLAATWHARATSLAAAFDRRNQTSEQGDRTAAALAAAPLVASLPLRGAVPRADARLTPAPATAPVSAPAPEIEASDSAIPDLATVPLDELRARWRVAWTLDAPAAETVARAVLDRADEFEAVDAGELHRARAYLARTGDPAARVEALEQAAAAYAAQGDAAGHLRTAGQLAVARALGSGGEVDDEVVRTARDACERARALGDVHTHVSTAVALVRVLGVAGDLEAAGGALAEVPVAEHPADVALVAQARAELAAAQRRWDEAAPAAREARAALLEAGQPVRAAQSANLVVDASVMNGDVAAAWPVIDHALATLRHDDDLAEWHTVRARVASHVGDVVLATESWTEAVARWTACGDAARAAEAGVSLGGCHLAAGRPLEAAEVLESALPGLDPDHGARARLLLLDAVDRLGERDEAVLVADAYASVATAEQRWYERARVDARAATATGPRDSARLRRRAVEGFDRAGDPVAAAREQRALAGDLILLGADGATPAFADARRRAADVEPAPGVEPAFELADCDYVEAYALWQVDDNEAGAAPAEAAEREFAALGATVPAARSALLRARLVAERGDADAARAHLDRARSFLDATDDPEWEREVDQVRGEVEHLATEVGAGSGDAR